MPAKTKEFMDIDEALEIIYDMAKHHFDYKNGLCGNYKKFDEKKAQLALDTVKEYMETALF